MKALGLMVVVIAVCGVAMGSTGYRGGLSTLDGGLIATGAWGGGSVVQWAVGEVAGGGYWHYQYELAVPGKDISHFIIETAPTLQHTDFTNFQWSYDGQEWVDYALTQNDVKLNTAGQGNPDLPESIYGIKFEAASAKTLQIRFDTSYAPAWGDMYAKGGAGLVLWNGGYTMVDPVDGPANGSIGSHLLVPGVVQAPVPEPASVGLLAAGGMLLLKKRRRA